MINYKPTYFDKVFLRRILASFLDILICLLLASIVWVVTNAIGFFTFGITKKAIPFILPVILIVYYIYSLGGRKGITFGMKLFKIDLLNNKNFATSFVYIFISLILCILFCYLGYNYNKI